MVERGLGFLAGVMAWAIERWVQAMGVPLRREQPSWLAGPLGGAGQGADLYTDYAATTGSRLEPDVPHAGLLPDFRALAGPRFDPGHVDPAVVDFYEHTADYTLDTWSQWRGPVTPFAHLLIALVSPRIQQLNLPLSPLDTSRGMHSRILRLTPPHRTDPHYAGWLRTNAATGAVIYAGFYTVCRPPREPGPCVQVVFPVPHGNVTVLLSPEVHPDGSLTLHSRGRRLGESGYYRLHRAASGTIHVLYLRLHETIHVYRDAAGHLRTDHSFRYRGLTFLRLHYKITRTTPP